MRYKGKNDFVSKSVSYLNNIYENAGDEALDVLIRSSNSFNFKNVVSTDRKGNTIDALSFKEAKEGGGDILAGSLMNNKVSEFNKIQGLSHELFHGLQYEKGQGGALIYNEVEARFFSNNIATNWAFSTENWLQANSAEGMGNSTYAGDMYEAAFSQLGRSYSAIVFKKACENFKKGSASNVTGLYNKYPLRKINQRVSILKQYYVKQKE